MNKVFSAIASLHPSLPALRGGLRRRLLRWSTGVADLVFANSCVLCHEETGRQSDSIWLCVGCREAMIDSLAFDPVVSSALIGVERDLRKYVSRIWRLGVYDGLLRSAVLRMKRDAEEALTRQMARMLVQARGADLASERPDVIAPIPMHWRRRALRGVNSPEILAAELARKLHIPVASHLIRRVRATAPQAELTPPARRVNVRRAFHVARHRDLAGARVLLVDDILTTGATAAEAARMFHRAGVAWVGVVVLARTR